MDFTTTASSWIFDSFELDGEHSWDMTKLYEITESKIYAYRIVIYKKKDSKKRVECIGKSFCQI